MNLGALSVALAFIASLPLGAQGQTRSDDDYAAFYQAVQSLGGSGGTQQNFATLAGDLDRRDPVLGLWLAILYPWLATGHWLDAITAPPGAARASGGGASPARGALPFEGLWFEGIRLDGSLLALDVAWEDGYPLPGNALDIFGTPDLSLPRWHYLWEEPLSPSDLLAREREILLDISGLDWVSSGFFWAANKVDTDGDGLTDAYERLVSKTDPHNPDTDGDGFSDWDEIFVHGTDPLNPDTDGDGIPDGDEVGWMRVSRDGAARWLDTSGGTNLFALIPNSNDDSVDALLPFPVILGNKTLSHFSANVNGLVGLSVGQASLGYGWYFGITGMNSMTRPSGFHAVIAAFWDDLRLYPAIGSAIILADVTTNGVRHCVIEYKDIGFNGYSANVNNSVSFQIVFTQGRTNHVDVLYKNPRGVGTGRWASIGTRTADQVFQYSFMQATVTDGLALSYRFGYGTDPLKWDTDGDGLSDGEEVFIHGTNPLEPDTDYDGLSDFWEVMHGFDPLDPLDGLSDSDGDGLSFAQEVIIHGTDPSNWDTDGDGLSDGEEAGGFSMSNDGIVRWFNTSGGTNLFASRPSSNDDSAEAPLPFPVVFDKWTLTHLSANANGLIGLSTSPASLGSGRWDNRDLNAYAVPSGFQLLVAGLWDDLRLYPAIGSAIILADVMTNGVRHCVIEYRNVGFYGGAANTDNMTTFQIVFTEGRTNRLEVLYKDANGLGDGQSATLGAHTANQVLQRSFNRAVMSGGLALSYCFGYGTDPLKWDTDGDGLSDWDEIFVHGTDPLKWDTDGDGLSDFDEIFIHGTDPLNWDTDGDRLPDGWEVLYGTDPLDPFDADADPDNDGLTNFDEYRHGTDPFNPDTDGDGVLDGDEVPSSPGSDPADPDDGGDPDNCVTVLLTVGDPSPSLSERWEMHITDVATGRTRRHCDLNFGQPGTNEYALVKGKEYKFTLKWIATNLPDPPGPDYDWCCLIDDSIVPGLRFDRYNGYPYIVEDPDNLLTELTHGEDPIFGGGNHDRTLGKEGRIIVPKVEVVQAEGENEGEPMKYLPIFTPQHGIGQGEPIYDCPDVDLTFVLSSANVAGIRSVDMTYLGVSYLLTETAQDSLAFTDGTTSLTLSDTLLDDLNEQGWVSASVTVPTLGITNAVYPCIESPEDSFIFENDLYGLVFSKSTAQFRISTMSFLHNVELTETATGTGIFTNGNMSVRVLAVAGMPCLAVSDGDVLTNAFFSVWETAPQSGIYRNYNEPIPTNLDPSDLAVPDFAPWRVKVTGVTNISFFSQLTVNTADDSIDQITFSVVDGSLLSDQKFILIPNRTLEASVPQEYTPLKIDAAAVRWQDEDVADVTIRMPKPGTRSTQDVAEAKAKPGAVVLESLDWSRPYKFLYGIRTSRIVDSLRKMRYDVVVDYSADAKKTLEDYIIGKQVWYSLSHGGTEDGTPYSSFTGLIFTNNAGITAGMLPAGLNYRLVMVDGCCAGSTGASSREMARELTEASSTVKNFANKFGSDVAYVSWAWEVLPNPAQKYTGQFLENLYYDKSTKLAPTIEKAHQKLPSQFPKYPNDIKLMKIYGNKNHIIDLRAEGAEQ